MAAIKRVDHIAIVVDDIGAALEFWRDSLGLELTHVEHVPNQESVVAFLPTGEAEIELVKPTSEDTGVAKYLRKRGPGIHHICLEVHDLESCLDELQSRGVRLINPEPTAGTGGRRVAFIHPESTHGVLVELYELSEREQEVRLVTARALTDRVAEKGQAAREAVLAFLREFGRDKERS